MKNMVIPKQGALLYVLLCFACFFCVHLHAQNIVDSLLNVLKSHKEDTNEVNALNDLSREQNQKGNYAMADSCARTELQLAKRLNFKKGISNAYGTIGIVYFHLGDYPNALENHLQALKIADEIGNKKGMATEYGNIGNIYAVQGNFDKALINFFQTLKISEEIHNKKAIAISYGNIGNIYFAQGNYTEALSNFKQAMKIDEEVGYKYGMSIDYGNIGLIYYNENKYPEALLNQLNALKIAEEIGDKAGMGYSFGYLGNIFIKIKKYKEAKAYLDSAITVSKSIGEKELIKNVLMYYGIYDSAIGDFKNYAEEYKLFIKYRDSLKNEEFDKRIFEQQIVFNIQHKEDSVKAHQEKENIVRRARENTRNIMFFSAVFLSILVILLATVLINRQKLKNKNAQIIFEKEKQRMEGELQHSRNMLDEYVKTMEEKNTILDKFKIENEELLKRILPEVKKENEERRIEQLQILSTASILTADDWDKFQQLFEQVHNGFFVRLREKLPKLTQAEIRLICLTKLGLKTQQMQGILGVSYNTIKSLRHNLRKKVDLSENSDLLEWIDLI